MPGEDVSSEKEMVPAELAFPAASVAVAETATKPLPRVVRSPEVRTTATSAAPLPMTVLVSVPEVPVKVTETEEPDSAVRVTMPFEAEAIELLTEAGVDRIVPWAASRSIGKGTDKFAITAREASKQSRRFRIPEVTDLATTAQICEAVKISDLAIAFHESATHKLSDQISSHNVAHLLIIIGPEGGLTDEELAAFEAAGAKVALMGRPILRSAHAGIAAVSAVSALLKVW